MKITNRHLVAYGTGVLVLQAAIGLVVYSILPTWTDRGTFGDMFGVANAMFSGLALAGIVITILLQQGQLQLQRSELRLSRSELRETRRAQQLQARISTLQYLAVHSELAGGALSALRKLHTLSVAVDETAQRALPLRPASELSEFSEQLATLIRDHFGSISYILGPDSSEVAGLVALQSTLWDIDHSGMWAAYESFTHSFTSVESFLVNTMTAVAEKANRSMVDVLHAEAALRTLLSAESGKPLNE
jgi:hypothetical protein